jgi:hypothetical protein
MIIEIPPGELPQSVRDYLLRMYRVIEAELQKDRLMNPTTKYVDAMVKAGTLKYFPSAITGTPITSGGLWFRDATTWTKLN